MASFSWLPVWRFRWAVLPKTATAKRPPNILLVMIDDMSARELGIYGHPTHRTPHLDRLAREGTWFRTCWATPVCGPSRAAINTGRFGHLTGWFQNELEPEGDEPGAVLSAGHRGFAAMLRDAGYHTAFAGKWQLRDSFDALGYQEWMTNIFYPRQKLMPTPVGGDGRYSFYWHPALVSRRGDEAEKIVPTGPDDYADDLATDFVIDVMRKRRDQPFFVFYSPWLIHRGWDYSREKMGFPAPPRVDQDGRRAAGRGEPTLQDVVEYTDHLMGRILRFLDESGLRKDTLVVFTADNGTSVNGKNRVHVEMGPRVPLIVSQPGTLPALGRHDALVSIVDFLPTFVDFAGRGADLAQAGPLDGMSQAAVWRGSAPRARDTLFSNWGEQQLVRDERYLLDGHGFLYDTRGERDEINYLDVSKDPQLAAVRERLQGIAHHYALPDHAAPSYQRWLESEPWVSFRRRDEQLKKKGNNYSEKSNWGLNTLEQMQKNF